LVADDGDGDIVDPGEAGDNRAIVGEAPVAMDFEKFADQGGDVIERLRPRRIARCRRRRRSPRSRPSARCWPRFRRG